VLAELARERLLPVRESVEHELTTLAGTPRHQGVVAFATEFPYEDLGSLVAAPGRVLVVVDRVQDPRNLGAIIRTTAAVGAQGVILPKDGAVGVTPTVEVAAAGSTATLPVCRVTNLVRSVSFLRDEGYWAIGLDAGGESDLFGALPRHPILLVIGGESGVRPLLRRTCDQVVSIPMNGQVESLNVSVAAGVALYEIRRQGR
jgi:23S rRNA (guanosine2251-2'-O)-methyltransferase